MNEEITLGGGCFWCLEAVFDRVDGVLDVESGYAMGHVPQPTYEQVCQGDTGHVEVVRLRFDPQRIGLADILRIFFAIHDPTTPDRQGNDVGPQYRSGIYCHTPQQRAIAEGVRDEADRAYGARVVTEIDTLRAYHPAEDYHQDYFAKHPHQGYCAHVVGPKVAKFQAAFAAHLKKPA